MSGHATYVSPSLLDDLLYPKCATCSWEGDGCESEDEARQAILEHLDPPAPEHEILAFEPRNNAQLMVACRDLGYVSGRVLDATYGLGRFWRDWRPDDLATNDLNPDLSAVHQHDFRRLPAGWQGYFDTVVLDGPYKLNGTGGSHASDEAYGVADAYVSIEDRHQLIIDGIHECARVLAPKGHLLVKCMAQVSSGQVQWQDIIFARELEMAGLRLVDRLLVPGYRKQPVGRTQKHARQNYSTLLVARKP